MKFPRERAENLHRTRFPARTILAFAFVALAFAPRPALAQEERITTPYRWIDRSLRVSLYGGYLFTDRGGLDQGPGSTALFGSRLRVRLSSPLSLELNVGYGSSDRYVVYPLAEGGPAVQDTMSANWVLLEAYMQLALTGARSLHRFQPYVLLGGGIVQGVGEEASDPWEVGTNEQYRWKLGTTPSLSVGAGFEWDISDRLGLAIEARDHIWRIKTPESWFWLEVLEAIDQTGAKAPSENYWTNNIELSASLYYYF